VNSWAEARQAREHAADSRAHLHGGSFKAQRRAGADLKSAQHKLADCFAYGDLAVAQSVSHLDLRNTATGGGRSEISESNTGDEAANGRASDGPPNPAMARGSIGTVNKQNLKPMMLTWKATAASRTARRPQW